jgi:uncharacterized protein YkwD
VWRETTRCGFGFAQTEDGKFYAVANYTPAGNYKYEFERNVLPPVNINSLLTAPLVTEPPKQSPPPPPSSTNQLKNQPQQQQQHHGEVRVTASSADDYNGSEDDSGDDEYEERGVDVGGVVGMGKEQSLFINEALHVHNRCRKSHGSEPLVLNAELCRIAQSHALYLAKTKSLMHSTNTYRGQKLGENLAYSYDSRINYYPGETATMQWYNEIKDYDFNGDYQKGTGHFTQVNNFIGKAYYARLFLKSKTPQKLRNCGINKKNRILKAKTVF